MKPTIKTTTHEVHCNPSGSSEHLSVIDLDSGKPGPLVYLQASVHGAEVQGNLVLFKLFEYLKENSFTGRFRLVPLANPRGLNHKVGTSTQGRFNPITGNNWNRNYSDISKEMEFDEFIKKHNDPTDKKTVQAFKKFIESSLEKMSLSQALYGPQENKRLNLTLQKLAANADIVLDLHTGPIACHYVYAPEYLKQKAKDLSFPNTLIIPNEFAGAMDEACFMPWVALERAYHSKGINFSIPFESYTLELGSEERISSKMAQEQLAMILTFLSKRGLCESSPQQVTKKQYWEKLEHYKTYFSPHAGLVEFPLAAGTHFKAGETLANIFLWPHQLENPWHSVIAQTNGVLINHTPSAVVSKGMELIQVLENPQPY